MLAEYLMYSTRRGKWWTSKGDTVHYFQKGEFKLYLIKRYLLIRVIDGWIRLSNIALSNAAFARMVINSWIDRRIIFNKLGFDVLQEKEGDGEVYCTLKCSFLVSCRVNLHLSSLMDFIYN